jgi:phosphoenolpyruvate-protein kinase (PTS system EI component)
MDDMFAPLVEAGILGLWTFSLLVQQRNAQKVAAEREMAQQERFAAERAGMTELREKVLADLKSEVHDIEHKLDTALDKIDQGLEAMREKYAEERAREIAELKASRE